MTTTTTKSAEAPEMPIADRLEHCAKFTGLDAVRELLVEAAAAVRKRDAVVKLLEGENAQTENSATGGASALTDVLERMRTRADNAYCDYIGQLRRDECLGWGIKVERGKFGEAELKAHCAAAEKLGRHRALHEAAKLLEEAYKAWDAATLAAKGTP